MRSHFILLTAAVLSTHAVQQGVAAAPILGPVSHCGNRSDMLIFRTLTNSRVVT